MTQDIAARRLEASPSAIGGTPQTKVIAKRVQN